MIPKILELAAQFEKIKLNFDTIDAIVSEKYEKLKRQHEEQRLRDEEEKNRLQEEMKRQDAERKRMQEIERQMQEELKKGEDAEIKRREDEEKRERLREAVLKRQEEQQKLMAQEKENKELAEERKKKEEEERKEEKRRATQEIVQKHTSSSPSRPNNQKEILSGIPLPAADEKTEQELIEEAIRLSILEQQERDRLQTMTSQTTVQQNSHVQSQHNSQHNPQHNPQLQQTTPQVPQTMLYQVVQTTFQHNPQSSNVDQFLGIQNNMMELQPQNIPMDESITTTLVPISLGVEDLLSPAPMSIDTVENWFDQLAQNEQNEVLRRLQSRKRNLPSIIPDNMPINMASSQPSSPSRENTEEH